MLDWVLVIMLWGGVETTGPLVIRFKQPTELACNAALTGMRFPPGVTNQSGWNYTNGFTAFCTTGWAQAVSDLHPPVVPAP